MSAPLIHFELFGDYDAGMIMFGSINCSVISSKEDCEMFVGRKIVKSIWRSVAEWWLCVVGQQDVVEHMNRCDKFAVAVSDCMLSGPSTQAEVKLACEDEVDETGKVVAMPRLVATVVVGMRMKLGMSAMDRSVPGNVPLVRRTAARLLRDYNVREVDAAAHLELIEKAFFGDDTHFVVGRARSRACAKSRFVKWLLGDEPVGFDC